MSDRPRFSKLIRFADLPPHKDYAIELAPDAPARAAIALELGLPTLRKLRFDGALSPVGSKDWQLTATLGATVVQECVVTFAPVTTRIDAPVLRSYLAELPDLGSDEEIEMPEDETVEPLPAELDLADVMIEALALALPEYPRAPDVAVVEQSYCEPGVAALKDEDTKPFAGLAGLRDKLAKGD